MNGFTKACLRPLILGLIVLVAVGCPQKKSISSSSSGTGQVNSNSNPSAGGSGSQQNGGGDYGGGNTISADDPSLVNRMLNFALAMAAQPDPYKNVYSQYWINRGMLGPEDIIQQPAHLFPNAKSPFVFEPPNGSKVDSPELLAISKAPIVRLKSGDCLKSLGETNSDASVDKHSLDATVCFSIGNLSRLGPGDLLRQIFSLVLHEASHMGGADEAEAQLWQRKFYDWFSERIGDQTPEKISTEQFLAAQRLEDQAADALNYVDTAYSDCNLHDQFQQLKTLASTIPFGNDPVAMQITYMTMRLDLIEDFTNRVAGISKKIKQGSASSGASCAPAMNKDDLKKFMQGLASDATEIRKSYLRLNIEFICDGNKLRSTGAYEARCTGRI